MYLNINKLLDGNELFVFVSWNHRWWFRKGNIQTIFQYALLIAIELFTEYFTWFNKVRNLISINKICKPFAGCIKIQNKFVSFCLFFLTRFFCRLRISEINQDYNFFHLKTSILIQKILFHNSPNLLFCRQYEKDEPWTMIIEW